MKKRSKNSKKILTEKNLKLQKSYLTCQHCGKLILKGNYAPMTTKPEPIRDDIICMICCNYYKLQHKIPLNETYKIGEGGN